MFKIICLCLFIASLNAESKQNLTKLEFLISYKAESKDGKINGEKYNISEPLVKKGHLLKIDYSCKIETPLNAYFDDDETYVIKYILQNYQDEVLDCFKNSSREIRYDSLSVNNEVVLDSILLELKAQRVLAYLDNRFLVLEILKEYK